MSKGGSTVAAPTVLSFRVLDLRRQSQSLILSVHELTIDGKRATLEMHARASVMPADGSEVCTRVGNEAEQCKPSTTIEMWEDRMAVTMTGTAKQHEGRFDLDFPREDPDSPHLQLTCTEQHFDVAPANAVVIEGANCAPAKWSLATDRVPLVGCTARFNQPMLLAPPPGIEQVVTFNDGCGDRPSMLRRVPADQSVMQAVASAP